MFCENCGAKMDDDSKFCDNCGSPAGDTGYMPPQQQYQPQQPYPAGSYDSASDTGAKKGKKKLRNVIIIIAVIAIAVAAYLLYSQFGTGSTNGYDSYNALIDSYFTAYNASNSNRIYSMYLPELRDYASRMGLRGNEEFLEEFDSNYFYYSNRETKEFFTVSLSKIVETEDWVQYDMFDYYYSDFNLGITPRQHMLITVECTDIDGDPISFYFELVELDNKWYAMEIW